MRNRVLRVHRKFIGPSKEAARWLPFAEGILDDLIDQSRAAGSPTLSRVISPQDGVFIIARIIAGQHFITIQVPTPCTDKEGHLLVRAGTNYDAHYNDGFVERINPITGTPRPDPDPATRTKGQIVSPDLYLGAFSGKPASKFTGLMRHVVGCYHSQGRRAPFSHNFTKTHGIVKRDTLVNNQPVTKYWIVEVTGQGVFAAPITRTSKCCDSWDVTAYMPTDAEIEANPSWSIYRTELSLYWALIVAGRTTVKNVIGDMTLPYGSGAPFVDGHGWAFSASGNKASVVTYAAENSPDPHYECSRFTLEFDDDGFGNLTGTVTANETDVIFAPLQPQEVWIPSGPGVWDGLLSFGSSSASITRYTNQDAPIFVYYDGEDEILVRYQMLKESVAAFTTPSFAVIGGTISWNSVRVYAPGPFEVINICQSPFTKNNYDHVYGGVGYNDNAFTRYTSGYYSVRQNRVVQNYSKVGQRCTTYTESAPTTEGVFSNSYGLDPSCYYIDPGPPPTLVTSCSTNYLATTHYIIGYKETDSYTQTGSGGSSIVLFAEEREAVLHVWSQGTSETGTKAVDPGNKYIIADQEQKVSVNLCPFTDWYARRAPPNVSGSSGIPSSSTAYSNGSGVGGAQLDLGSQSIEVTATILGAPYNNWSNYNLQTFLIWNNSTKTTAESNVFAMHGNLYYDEPTLTPPEQRDNAVYVIDNDVVTVGGFAVPPFEVIAFVGRA